MDYVLIKSGDAVVGNLTSDNFTSPPIDWAKTYSFEGLFEPTAEIVENGAIELEMEYYLKRKDKYYFRDEFGMKLIVETPQNDIMKALKRGMKCKVKYKL